MTKPPETEPDEATNGEMLLGYQLAKRSDSFAASLGCMRMLIDEPAPAADLEAAIRARIGPGETAYWFPLMTGIGIIAIDADGMASMTVRGTMLMAFVIKAGLEEHEALQKVRRDFEK